MPRLEPVLTETAKQQLLEVLQEHPSGLRSEQVCNQINARGSSLELAATTRLLNELQHEGQLIYRSRCWVLKSQPPSVLRPATPASQGSPKPESTTKAAQPALVGSSSTLIDRSMACIPCQPMISGVAQAPLPALRGGSLPKRCALLRSLIPYWRACLRTEERPNTLLPLERAGAEFCGLTTAASWWPTEQRRAELTISSEHLSPALLAAFARHGAETDIFIGYPLQLIPGTDDRPAFARPIFTFACSLEMSAGALKLTLPPQPVDINADWLEKQFRNPAERRRVLRWLGILGATGHEDDSTDETSGESVDLATATVRLNAYLRAETDTTLTPTALATSLPLHVRTYQITNVLALFAAPTTKYSKRSLADLARLAQWTDQRYRASSLGTLFDEPPSSLEETPPPVLPPLALNEEQLNATRMALSHPLTVITGPPGTGKSQVVTAIMASAALSGKTALVASKNHKALDAVEQRLAGLLEDDRTLLARASRPFGNGQLFDLQRAADALFARGSSTGARPKLANAVKRLRRIDQELSTLEAHLERQAEIGDQIAEAESRIDDAEYALTETQRTWIEGGFQLQPPAPPSQRACQKTGLKGLLAPLCRWLLARRDRAFLGKLEVLGIPWSSEDSAQRLASYRRMYRYYKALQTLEAAKEQRLPDADLRRLEDQVVDGRQKLAASSADLFRGLPAALDDLEDEVRPELAEMSGAMALFAGEKLGEEGVNERRRVMQRALPKLLKHFPLWAVTNLSAGRALPLIPGLFDYVIIDEASQCDVASAIPLLARAKRAIIVGDPAQLRHVTKLTQERELRLLEANGLLASGIGRWSYRSQSLFNIAAAIPGVSTCLLRDHYRSASAVADYCNQAFYGGRLRVLTDESRLMPPPGQRLGIHWTDVRGIIQPAASGCHAPAEADAILEHLQQILVEQEYAGTIGIVTPFSEQAKRITDRLTSALPSDLIVRARLGAFTAHQFQGDARDLILLSLCLGPDMPAGSRAFLSDNGYLINVAVSRARAVCQIFGHRDAAEQSAIPHILKLLRAADSPSPSGDQLDRFESPWEERLYQALKDRGIEPIPQFPVAGRRLDLAIVNDLVKLDVEVDGDRYHRDPSGRRKSSDLWRDHQLRSLGWRVKRYWVYQLRENLDGCVDDIIASANG